MQKAEQHINTQTDKSRSGNLFFQPKLSVNQPGDMFEQEADEVADKVMRMNDPSSEKKFFSPPVIQRKCDHCEEEEKKKLQRKEMGNVPAAGLPDTERYLSSLQGGKSLSNTERSFFEPGMSYDFSNVTIHTDANANQSAKNINALAYTKGNNIVFGADQYKPETSEGKKLMAHELTHVMQQDSGSIKAKKASPDIFRKLTPKDHCNIKEDELKQKLNDPLPWGIAAGDTPAQIEAKKESMRTNAVVRDMINNCFVMDEAMVFAIRRAENLSIQQVSDEIDKGQPFVIIRRQMQDQVLEGWMDPKKLPGSNRFVNDIRYVVNGQDASAGKPVNMPGLQTPQCGDNCSADERKLTPQQFSDDNINVRSCCSTQDCSTLHDRIAKGEANTRKAIERVKAGLSMNNVLNKHFKRNDDAAVADILEGLQRILPEVQFSRHLWVCRAFGNEAEGCKSAVRAGANIGGRASTWRIALCFNNGDISWSDVLHEIIHASSIGRSSAEMYLEDSGYPPDYALENADSYASFIKEVGEPGWTEETPQTFDTKVEAGLALQKGNVKPVFGARLEWTPRGPGLRVFDIVGGPSLLWAPNGGLLSQGGTGNELLGGGEIDLRIRPSKSLFIDVGTGGFVGYGEEGFAGALIPKASITWKPGGQDSGFTLGADLQAVYSAVQAQPNAMVFGLSLGYRSERKPQHRKR